MNDKNINVGFISHKLKDQFNSLDSGKHEDKKLFDFIDRAMLGELFIQSKPMK